MDDEQKFQGKRPIRTAATLAGVVVAIGVIFLYLNAFGAPKKEATLEQFTIPLTGIDDSQEIAE